jgi:hypothetical protein
MAIDLEYNYWFEAEITKERSRAAYLEAETAKYAKYASAGATLLNRLFAPHLITSDIGIFGGARIDATPPNPRNKLPLYALTGYFPVEVESRGLIKESEVRLVIAGNFLPIGQEPRTNMEGIESFDAQVATIEIYARNLLKGSIYHIVPAGFRKDQLNPSEGHTGFNVHDDMDPEQPLIKVLTKDHVLGEANRQYDGLVGLLEEAARFNDL